MKRQVLLIVRLAVAAAGIGFIAYSITWRDTVTDGELRPGMLAVLREARLGWLFGGLLLMGLIPPGQALRWWMLLTCRGVTVTYARALRLTLIGLFFNLCMPGTTGGDVVRAWYAARGRGKRGAAVMSIAFDRVTGMVALFLLAALAGLARLDDALVRLVTQCAWGMLGAMLLIGAVYFSPTARRTLGLRRLLDRLDERHLVRRIDAAAEAYRHHLPTLAVAVALSVAVHLGQIAATALAGYALGVDAPLTVLLVVLPVLMAAGAMPLTYQGLGVMEALGYVTLVAAGYATNNQVVAMLMVMRLYLVFYGLVGAITLLPGDVRLHTDEPAV